MVKNTFSNKKRKMFDLWQDSESNRGQIIVDKDTNKIIVNNLQGANKKNLIFNNFLDFTTNWDGFDIAQSTLFPDFPPQEIFKSWNFIVTGIPVRFAGALTHSFNIKFGAAEFEIENSIRINETRIRTLNYIEVDGVPTNSEDENLTDNVLTYHFGIKLDDSNDLEEVQNGIKVRLNLQMFHPNLYQ